MRRKKIVSVIGALSLTVASMSGCGSGDKDKPAYDVTTPSISIPDLASQTENAFIQSDDRKISTVYKTCLAKLSEDDYYMAVDDNVEIRIAADGTVTVFGLSNKAEDLMKEIYKAVSGNENGPILFLSQAYKNGGETTLKFSWNVSLYSWSGVFFNQNEGSRYYRPATQEAPTQPTLAEVEDAEAVNKDDAMIAQVSEAFKTLLAEEKYYSVAEDTVKVNVSVKDGVGALDVIGFGDSSNAFMDELTEQITKSKDGTIQFQSKAYEGSLTEIKFNWNPALYTWQETIKNDVESSMYDSTYYPPGSGGLTTEDPNNANGTKTRIEVLSYNTDIRTMIHRYMDLHPEFAAQYDVYFTVVSTDNGAYQMVLDSSLSGEDNTVEPDLYVAEDSFVVKYTSGSASSYACTYEELGIDVETRMQDADIAPYLADVTRRDGKVVGLGYQSNGCAFIYNRDVAMDVFGDDDPKTVEAALGTDWESFFAAAEKCKEKGYAIVSGPEDIWTPIKYSADHGWVVDGKLYIDPKREAYIDYAKRMADYAYSNGTVPWTEPWFNDMAERGPMKVLGFYGPAWFVTYTLSDNCGGYPDDDYNKGTFGRWAACRPNVYSYWDGEWLIANKKVLKNQKLKDGVRQLVEFITLDTSKKGVQYQWANGMFEESGYMKKSVASRKVMEKSDGSMSMLGYQNAYSIFSDAAEGARGDNRTEYDGYIGVRWVEAVRSYVAGEQTRDQAIEWFKQSIHAWRPEIAIN